ncbi:hypothetical protein [Halobellus rubicundus]|uniref:PGF-CTERM sorting domain-containing protein n=1 Tax=Halobellus rubicundus TaxID=2996466 RepID=A0ABD5MDT2_9EURY
MPSARAILAVLLIVSLSIAPVTGQSSEEYEITLDQETDIPERTLDTDSGEFTISVVGRYAKGGTVEVSTSAPSGTSYAIRLIDSQERLRASAYEDGDGNARFSLDRYAAGTYAIVITDETDADDVHALKPLVIYGYTVTQRTPNETETDSTLDVEFSLTKADDVDVDEPPASVEVGLGNDSTSITTEATRTEDLNYTAEIDTSALSPGDYRLYTGVQRDNTIYGYQELIGVNTYQVSVVEASTETPTATDTQTTTGGADGTQSGPGAPPAGAQTTAPAATNTPENRTTTTTMSPNSTHTATTEPISVTDTTGTSSISTRQTPSDDDSASAPSPASDSATSEVSQTEDGSSTPVSTPVLPDGAVFGLCLVAVAVLSRLR